MGIGELVSALEMFRHGYGLHQLASLSVIEFLHIRKIHRAILAFTTAISIWKIGRLPPVEQEISKKGVEDKWVLNLAHRRQLTASPFSTDNFSINLRLRKEIAKDTQRE